MSSAAEPALRKCNKCEQEFPLTQDNFYRGKESAGGYLRACIKCVRAAQSSTYRNNSDVARKRSSTYYAQNKDAIAIKARVKYQANKDKVLAEQKVYRQKNPDKVKQRRKKYRLNNVDRIKAVNRAYNKKRPNDWRKKNPERAREYHRAYSKAWLSDGKRKAGHSLTVLVAKSLKSGKDGASWETMLGFTRRDLVRHLERQFQSGMSWNNYGEWHIDHIVPLAHFSFSGPTDQGFLDAWALTNLRPLWSRENMSKGGRRTLLL